MPQGIHIKSLEALRDFQTSLMLYRHETEDALDKAEMEAEQALADVGDALSTALQQIEDSRDELAQARDDLNTCQGGYGDEEDDEPDCSAEEQAVVDAEEALRKAEERADALQHARRRLDEAVEAYRSQARYLKEFLELDLLCADGTLAAKIEAIEAYLGVAAPATPSLPASVHTGSSLRAGSEPRQEPTINTFSPPRAAQVRPVLPKFVAGGKTSGVLRVGMTDTPLRSGRDGPASSLPKQSPGFNAITSTHVEGHVAARMRQQGIQEATLYINNPAICLPCQQNLAHMLPPGSRLTVVLSNGMSKVFFGNPR